MSDGGNSGRVVLHPRVAEKLAEIEKLRHDMAVLIEKIDDLLYRKRDAILARYAREIGQLEYELYRLEATIAELRYRVAFLQAEVNRGKAVTAAHMAVLDRNVAAEFEKTRKEIERREEELKKSGDYLNGPMMSLAEARELRSLYRKLCKKHHPDVCGNESGAWKRHWALLQHAYGAGDLELLKTLAEHADAPEDELPEAPDALDAEIERLQSRIEMRKKRIAGMLSSPPWSYEEKLLDPGWVSAKQEELRQTISVNETARKRLQALYETLLPSSGSVH